MLSAAGLSTWTRTSETSSLGITISVLLVGGSSSSGNSSSNTTAGVSGCEAAEDSNPQATNIAMRTKSKLLVLTAWDWRQAETGRLTVSSVFAGCSVKEYP